VGLCASADRPGLSRVFGVRPFVDYSQNEFVHVVSARSSTAGEHVSATSRSSSGGNCGWIWRDRFLRSSSIAEKADQGLLQQEDRRTSSYDRPAAMQARRAESYLEQQGFQRTTR
jgi:hypothetical protein